MMASCCCCCCCCPRQYETAADIPSSVVRTKNVNIKGRVERVIDGDTLRIRHLPCFPWIPTSSYQGNLSDNTISVRIYGVDCPEMGKGARPSMFQAPEAKEFTKQALDGKVVTVTLLRKDQYGRIIGRVTYNRFSSCLDGWCTHRDLSWTLARNGYATLYTQGGAEYCNRREELEKAIELARCQGLGIWSQGQEPMSPADYKRMYR